MFSCDIHSQWKIYKHLNMLKSEKSESFRSHYCIFVYYPDRDMFSSKRMGRFCHILEGFYNFLNIVKYRNEVLLVVEMIHRITV